MGQQRLVQETSEQMSRSNDDDVREERDMKFASTYDIAQMQEQCVDCRLLLHYLRDGILPRDDQMARKKCTRQSDMLV